MAKDNTPFDPASEDTLTVLGPLDDRGQLADRPASIGPYRLLRPLGEGGMGEVWEAQQKEPIERTVALKLVKLGMDTKQFVARFESERQALALMEHPCIARVIDGGATESGRPYFVMEYVRGVSITEYCDESRLTIRERLELFMRVCEGVQHAHQKGIIHRDLKPSNVMVTEVDGEPMPKIIDFGVAKATTQSLTDKTVKTVLGGWIGTPAYMSPEQAEITDDIDTRTDVYSLGAMLYELLTGLPPFDAETLGSKGFDEMRRVIREVEPPRPSTRASEADATEATFPARQVEPKALRRKLQGDLDWIVMRALEKEKERRYGSPAEMLADIERHLSSEPVLAGPASTAYRAGKFVRRHRIGVAFAAFALVFLSGFAITAAVQASRIATERDRANLEARAASTVADFLVDIFASPAEGSGEAVTAREVLDRGAARIARELQAEPLLQGRLQRAMGAAYTNLGSFEAAKPLLLQAVETLEAELGPEHLRVARALQSLGSLYTWEADYEQAQMSLERALTIYQASEGVDRFDLAFVLHTQGQLLLDQARFEEAGHKLRAALEIYEEVSAETPDQPLFGELPGRRELQFASVLSTLGTNLSAQGRKEEALPYFQRAASAAEPYAAEHQFQYAMLLTNLGAAHAQLGQLEAAAKVFASALRIERVVLSDSHPTLATTLHNLGNLQSDLGDLDQGQDYLRQALAIRERVFGGDHPAITSTLNSIASNHLIRREFAEAEAQWLRSERIRRTRLGPDHPSLALTIQGLGDLYSEMGRLEEAVERYEEAIRIMEGANLPNVATLLERLGGVLTNLGRDGEAVAALDRARELREQEAKTE